MAERRRETQFQQSNAYYMYTLDHLNDVRCGNPRYAHGKDQNKENTENPLNEYRQRMGYIEKYEKK